MGEEKKPRQLFMKPILFNTEMVRAILDGRKTVTRRVVKQKAVEDVLSSPARRENPDIPDNRFIECLCTAPCTPGDILYLRETWTTVPDGSYVYKASTECPDAWKGTWHPSIHMPREAARLFLRVTGVQVERLQDMRLADCLKEGVQLTTAEQGDLVIQGVRARDRFSRVWDRTIKPADLLTYGWAANPWVWVIEFERCNRPERDEKM